MKKIYYLAISFVILACTQVQIELPIEESNPVNAYDRLACEDSLLIAELGYEINKFVDYGEYYIVNDLYCFEKKDIMLLLDDNPLTKLSQTFVVKKPSQRIRIDFPTSSEYDYERELLREAIAEWNALEDCNICFSLIDENEGIDTNDWFETSFLICNNYEEMLILTSYGIELPAQIVNFNNTLPIWTNASAEQQKYAFMHILGLILGLTDSYDNGGNHIHGTMEKDPSSIMRKYTDLEDHPNDCWDGFSFYDRIDIPQAFPLIADDVSISLSNPSFDNVEYICEGEQIISADAVFNIPTKFLPNTVLLYSISLYNDTKKQQCAYFNDCDSIQYLFEKGNTYTLTVTVKRRDNGYEVAKKDFVINVIDNPMITVTYPESVSVNSFFNMEFESPYGRPNINIIADELIFDQSDENVEAIQESDNLWKIRLLDYGTFHIHYCLGTTSNVIGTLICSIFYRPDYVMNDTSWLEQLEYVAYTPVAGEAVVIPESSSVERVKILSVTIGSDTFLSNRFYGIVDKKYYFNRFFPLYMEHGMMSTEGYMLILEAGSNATYHFPPISDYKYQGNEYVGEGYEILGTDMYEATYTGFYSLYIPEDSLSLDENYFNDNI